MAFSQDGQGKNSENVMTENKVLSLLAEQPEPTKNIQPNPEEMRTISENQDLTAKTNEITSAAASTNDNNIEEAGKPMEEQALKLPAQEQKTSSQDLVELSWEASGQNDLNRVTQLTTQCEELYGEKAKKLEAVLNDFPTRGKEADYQILNDAATCMFIRAEALMNNGKSEEAQVLFEKIIEQFKWGQAWDPSRGAFWSIAEKSQASIDMMIGKAHEEEEKLIKDETKKITKITLSFKGKEDVIDYTKYGKFFNVGTKDYHYEISDPKGLSDAVGEGIYPNTGAVIKSPGYKKALQEGRLEGSHWDFVHCPDLEAAYYKWATAPEPWGVKLFYLGLIFEKSKMYYEAIKAYHAIVVHFPQAVGWTYWQTPWYPAQAAIAKVKYLIRQHPELNLMFRWAQIKVVNGFDNDINNDVILTYPGVISKKNLWDQLKGKIDFEKLNRKFNKLGKIQKTIGSGQIRLVQYENGHWQMLVDGKPYMIKGLTYTATKVGQSPDKGTLTSWMDSDVNGNGKMDGPYDSWVDKNNNNEQDPDEPVVGDFELIKEMGVNTIRQYHQPFEINKELLRDLYKKYGIRVIMGDFLGKYTLGSGAGWREGTDYENPQHRKNMLESVQKMVLEFKDEPYILMWLLGNENNYGVASNADKKPDIYYQFANEVAQWIKSVDKNHPVALCNGDTLYLDKFAKNAPDIDVYGANLYRGDYGFGSFWEQVAGATGKPAFVTEFGCPSYALHLTLDEGETAQADYHRGNWTDIQENSAGYSEGSGNALGGVIFEWMDEWWKNYEPFFHDRKSDAIGPFPGGYYYEEWFGLSGQGNGKKSPFLRHLRKSYYAYQEMLKD